MRALAWQCVADRQLPAAFAKEYRQLALGAFALVANVGLLQALAYWEEQGAGKVEPTLTAGEKAAKHLARDICRAISNSAEATFDSVAAQIRATDALGYRALSAHALEFLRWLRLFCAMEGDDS
jgi:CRISPR/Cas system CMR-associated protein Cmr5 small subunit